MDNSYDAWKYYQESMNIWIDCWKAGHFYGDTNMMYRSRMQIECFRVLAAWEETRSA